MEQKQRHLRAEATKDGHASTEPQRATALPLQLLHDGSQVSLYQFNITARSEA